MTNVVDVTSKNTLPDHTQLPDSDGTFVKNFQEHPQTILPKMSDECPRYIFRAKYSLKSRSVARYEAITGDEIRPIN